MASKARFLTVKEAAKTLEVSPNTVRARGANGKLPEYRHPLNNYRLFRETDVERVQTQITKPVLRSIEKTKPSKRREK